MKEKTSVTWKKKVYDPPGYTGAIREEDVDGDPVSMPEVWEWYGYANKRIIHISHHRPYNAPENWFVELGKMEEVKNSVFPHLMLFVADRRRVVYSVKEAHNLAMKWLLV